jgi:putative membrane protein
VTVSFLDTQAEAVIRQRVAALENAAGIEVATAVIARADSYPEIPWKAFALGVSVAALGVVAIAARRPGWEAFEAIAETAVIVLAAGATAALATIWSAPFARWFLPVSRREAETLQYAQAMFLESGLSGTTHRNGILLLVSLFERQVVAIADSGLREKIGASGLGPVIAVVTGRLANASLPDALLDGLTKLEEILVANGFHAPAERVNELPDAVLQQREPV